MREPRSGVDLDRRPDVRTLRSDPGERPFIVIWEVTRACGLACSHCRAEAIPDRHPAELTTEQGRRLLDDLASLGTPRPLVVLTGGDPFERDDLAELVAHGTARGLTVSLAPSVTPRFTRATLSALRDAGAKAVSLSLDGASARVHDRFRGVEGVFDATIDAARTVRELGLRLQLNTTVTRDTVADLPAILQHAIDLRASLWSVFFLVPTGRGRDLDALDAYETEDVLRWLHDAARFVAIKTTEAPHFRRVVVQSGCDGDGSPLAVPGALYDELTAASRTVLDGLPERRAPRPPLDVNAGKGFVFVDHLGAVYPSGFLPIPVGSIRDRPLTRIYREAPLLRQLRDPSRLGGRCGRCGFAEVCGGSRSRAYAVTGDPFAGDPTCAFQPDVEVQRRS